MKRSWRAGAAVLVFALTLVPSTARAQTTPQAPVRVGGNIREPRLLKRVEPAFPEAAQAAGVAGVVILEITIGTDGKVANATILRHVPLHDQAALDAVTQWEFEPTLLNGAPVPVIMTVTVNFPLRATVSMSMPAIGQGVQTLRVGGAFPMPEKTKDVIPELPDSAKQAGVTGTIVLEITIGTTGKVENATIFSHAAGTDDIGRAALDAVKQWEFKPTLLNGMPVRIVSSVRVDFTKDGVRVTTPNEPGVPAAPGQPLRVGGNIPEPVKTRYVAPVYPPEALQAHVTGVVIIEATIDAEGNVADAKVLRSVPLLDAAALDAVRQWKYRSTMMNGVAVPIIMIVTVNFTF